MLYKRVNLGITLNATALFFAFLAVDWIQIPHVIYQTATDPLTISTTFATFGIMWLSQLYKETGVIKNLSESLGKIIRNPKIILSVLPAVIGFLPVSGGALMSAPLVDSEAAKLKMKPEKKAYVNLWFRHTIFPVYPLSQPLILTAALTMVAMPLLILRQIPVVLIMIVVGYVIGFWKISQQKSKDPQSKMNSHLKDFLIAFSPILTTIVAAIVLNLVYFGEFKTGFDILIATFIGLIALIAISKSSFRVSVKPLKSWGIYGVTFAAAGAFLLRNSMDAGGISNIFKTFVANGSLDIIVLLTVVPAILGLITGSPSGGVAIAVSILTGILSFSPKVAALIYISAYLGYTVAPTHLCFQFTADYFKCSLSKMYKYVIPSFLVSFAAALLVYFLIP
jgi:integral membrane protein (TIGR00529 family)